VNPLTVRETMALTLADTPYRYPGAREARALDHLGLTPTRFYALVNRLIDEPRAEAWDARVVRRLRRLRERRAEARNYRRVG
jgi:hypothetical protein